MTASPLTPRPLGSCRTGYVESHVTGSEIEDQLRTGSARDADEHGVVGCLLVIVEQGVAVIDLTRQNRGLAGAAGAFPAGPENLHAGIFDDVEDGAARRDVQGHSGCREFDLERV